MRSLLPYWWVIEAALVIVILAVVLLWVFRFIKQRRANPVILPKTISGRISFVFLHILRILGVGSVTAIVIAFVVMFDRDVFTFLAETAPAPSKVMVPANLPFEVQDVKFEGGDGLKMSGWSIPSKNGVTIILLHGYSANRMAMLWHAKQLVDAGYGVLLYDERASGESEGTRRSFGWEDPRDVAGAIRFIETESTSGVERIGIGGCSVGAQIALQSAAAYPELEAVWADGPATVRVQDIPRSKNLSMKFMMISNYALDWLYETQLHLDVPPMIDQIGKIAPRPIMMVGGGVPHFAYGSEAEMMIPIYAQHAGSNAQVWIIPEAVHCDGPARRPEEYAQRMVEFFDTAFGVKR